MPRWKALFAPIVVAAPLVGAVLAALVQIWLAGVTLKP